MKKRLNRTDGMTLVELLVAVVIGLLLAGGIHQVFVSSSDSYQVNNQLARMQESGRFAMQILRQELRGAGYLGCAQDVTAFTNTLNGWDDPNDASSLLFNFSQPIHGLEAIDADTWSDGSDDYDLDDLQDDFGIIAPVSDSDILFVRGPRGGDIALYTQGNMQVDAGVDSVEENDILMISDCLHASVFQVTAFAGGIIENEAGNPAYPGNFTADLGHDYGVGSEILHVQTGIFYVRLNPDGQPSLYFKRGVQDPVELVEGVEAIRVRYGTGDDYVSASNVSDWADVRSVRIGLLLRSPTEIARGPMDNNTYDVSGDGDNVFTAAGDRRLRLVMSGTVGLRNRLR